jgi:hypothetical protein
MVADAMMKAPTRRRARTTLSIAGVLLLGLASGACAPMSEVEQEAREFENADFENEFIAYRQQCVANGGRVFVLANGRVDRRGIPSRGTYYTCS